MFWNLYFNVTDFFGIFSFTHLKALFCEGIHGTQEDKVYFSRSSGEGLVTTGWTSQKGGEGLLCTSLKGASQRSFNTSLS